MIPPDQRQNAILQEFVSTKAVGKILGIDADDRSVDLVRKMIEEEENQGLGSAVKKRYLSKLIKERRPQIMLVQETKVEIFEKAVIQRFWGNAEVEYAESRAVGASRGILTMSNKEDFKSNNIIVNRNLVLIAGSYFQFD
ncbi:hypothetical protein Vadar_001885 [Vaccinium darrowii]|uniref:Uncharacterized protein n=1 Tax=Vaccinium darrowii TaxID=229202 RepID=A0ACB7XML4_9ERIC|nr:hypothetical protein Vadar_001885 [Vaccinium darrowii]